MNNPILEFALYYASRGWHVFPIWGCVDGVCLCPQGEACGKNSGKHPQSKLAPNGLKDSTSDPKIIRRWFDTGLTLNIGIRTGAISGLVVLDCDPRHGGDESLRQFTMPQTLTAATGGGGQHFFFQHPGGHVPNSSGKLAPGLDVRGDGGYVVAAPSEHLSGNVYRWSPLDPRSVEIAPYPPWMLTSKPVPRTLRQAPGPIREGARNDQLTRTAGRMRREGLSAKDIYEILSKKNAQDCTPPLPEDEVRRIASSIGKYEPAPKRFNLTELGNAERLVHLHGDRLRYDSTRGKWLFYDGTRWNIKRGNQKAHELAKETIRSILAEASTTSDDDERAKLARWSMASERSSRIIGMLSLARYIEPIPCYSEQFDTDPLVLNCTNGTIDLRTGELRSHKASDMISRLAPVVYDPKAVLSLWHDFLWTACGYDGDLMSFLQVAAGYSATGDTAEEKLFFPFGPTASGKSTFLEALSAALGDYAMVADFETFLKRPQGSGARNDIARLHGARLVLSIEVDEGSKLAEGLVKQLTGGDKITARFLYRESFEFSPQFKLWLAANDEPRVSDTDSAIWRRILQLPFSHTIPAEERDPNVKKILKNPVRGGPAVLAWIVEGTRRWLTEGLKVPEVVSTSTQEYRQRQDPLADFFEDMCMFEEQLHVPAGELRARYLEYCRDAGIQFTLSPRAMAKRLRARGCEPKTVRTPNAIGTVKPQKCWVGIALNCNRNTRGLTCETQPAEQNLW